MSLDYFQVYVGDLNNDQKLEVLEQLKILGYEVYDNWNPNWNDVNYFLYSGLYKNYIEWDRKLSHMDINVISLKDIKKLVNKKFGYISGKKAMKEALSGKAIQFKGVDDRMWEKFNDVSWDVDELLGDEYVYRYAPKTIEIEGKQLDQEQAEAYIEHHFS